MNIFPAITFTSSELLEVETALCLKALIKYLHSLAYTAGADICSAVRENGESAESFLIRIENVKGGLGVINTLLQVSVSKAESAIESSNNQS